MGEITVNQMGTHRGDDETTGWLKSNFYIIFQLLEAHMADKNLYLSQAKPVSKNSPKKREANLGVQKAVEPISHLLSFSHSEAHNFRMPSLIVIQQMITPKAERVFDGVPVVFFGHMIVDLAKPESSFSEKIG